MTWGAVGAALASAAISQYNTNRTAKKQDRAAAEGIRKQAELQQKANARMNEQLTELEKSTPDDEFDTRSSQIRDQLRRKHSMALAGIQNYGGGDDVTAMADAAKPTATAYGDFINQSLSGMDAPILQRRGEAFERADTGSLLAYLGRNSAQEDYLTRLKMAGIRDNPWLSMLSAGLGAYSGAAGMGGSIAGAGKTPVNPSIAAASSAQMPFNTPDYSIFGKGKYGIGPYLGGP
jgi:hypothetical protein